MGADVMTYLYRIRPMQPTKDAVSMHGLACCAVQLGGQAHRHICPVPCSGSAWLASQTYDYRSIVNFHV